MASLSSFTPTTFTHGTPVNFTASGSGIPTSPPVSLVETVVPGLTWSVNASTVTTSPDGTTLTFTATSSNGTGIPCGGSLRLKLMLLMPTAPVTESVNYN